jgi:hypothetical protein
VRVECFGLWDLRRRPTTFGHELSHKVHELRVALIAPSNAFVEVRREAGATTVGA